MRVETPDVNVERVQRVIDALKHEELVRLGVGFNMGPWITDRTDREETLLDKSGHDCGTVACIGGTAAIIQLLEKGEGIDKAGTEWGNWLYRMTQDNPQPERWLGISDVAASQLFGPDEVYNLREIPLHSAIRVLEILRDEQAVDWAKALMETGMKDLIYREPPVLLSSPFVSS